MNIVDQAFEQSLVKLVAAAPQTECQPQVPTVHIITIPSYYSALMSMSAEVEQKPAETNLFEHRAGVSHSIMESGMNCTHIKSGRSEKWE